MKMTEERGLGAERRKESNSPEMGRRPELPSAAGAE